MKKACIVLTLALLVIVAPIASAQTTITFHPLGHLLGVTSLEYETSLEGELGRGRTLAAQAVFGDPGFAESEVWMKGVGLGIRYYTAGQVHQGLYLGGYASTTSVRGKYEGRDVRGNVFGIHGIGGNKWRLSNGLVIDAGVGIGFPVSAKGDLLEHHLESAFDIGVGLGLGYSF